MKKYIFIALVFTALSYTPSFAQDDHRREEPRSGQGDHRNDDHRKPVRRHTSRYHGHTSPRRGDNHRKPEERHDERRDQQPRQ